MPRSLTRFLWLAIVVYTAWLTATARGEITTDVVATGPFGEMRPPYDDGPDLVFAPRRGSIVDELLARYGLTFPLLFGMLAVAETGGTASAPSVILWPGNDPWLVIATSPQLVVFDPSRGMVLIRKGAAPADVPSLRLVGVSEAPW